MNHLENAPEAPRAPREPADGESGQAIVEAAIVMPAMVFLILTILQLTMVQHARIMTEYAAFCAARAGIVYNASGKAMHDAAELALLPTIARTDTFGALAPAVLTLGKENLRRGVTGVPLIRGKTLSPLPGDFNNADLTRHLKASGAAGKGEIDFDDVRSIAARPNQLQIELKYNYRMRIPFANRILHAIYMAGTLGSDLTGLKGWRGFDLSRPEGAVGVNPMLISAGAYAAKSADPDAVMIAAAAQLPGKAGSFYFPLKATYTMRMQSNAFKSNAADW